jgi:glutamyl-tRNA reductase
LKLIAWGINHKTAAVELRERLAVAQTDLDRFYERLRERGFSESMVISTCNRTEIYACSEDLETSDLLEVVIAEKGVERLIVIEASREFEGLEVADHLFRVVSSLDSMVIGEPEIVSQVKSAYQWAKEKKSSGKWLNNLVQKSFQVAKRVRTETDLSSRPTSVGAVGASLALQIFGHQGAKQILVMGAGEMAEVSLKNLMGQVEDCELMVCNRSPERAQALAASFGGQSCGLDRLQDVWKKADIVICSMGTNEPIITDELMKEVIPARGGRPLFVIDLGVPRNVDPILKQYEDFFLYDMDDLQCHADDNMKYRRGLIESCEPYISEGLKDFELWVSSLDQQQVISDVMHRNSELIETELQKSMKKLDGLNDDQIQEVRYLVSRVLKKAMHHPIHSLRNEPMDSPARKVSWRDFFFGS